MVNFIIIAILYLNFFKCFNESKSIKDFKNCIQVIGCEIEKLSEKDIKVFRTDLILHTADKENIKNLIDFYTELTNLAIRCKDFKFVALSIISMFNILDFLRNNKDVKYPEEKIKEKISELQDHLYNLLPPEAKGKKDYIIGP